MLSIFKAIRATGYELSIWVDAMGIIDLTALRQHIMRQRDFIWDGLDVCPRTCPSTSLDAAHMPSGLRGLRVCMLVRYWIFLSLLLA